MSANANPITPARFAAALEDLSVASLYAKAAEIRNSMLHLNASNEQLRPFVDDGDVDCAEALQENEEVIGRMRERVELLKAEVERRGNLWIEAVEEEKKPVPNGIGQEQDVQVVASPTEPSAQGTAVSGQGREAPHQSGSLTDAELAQRIHDQMGDEEEGGLHL